MSMKKQICPVCGKKKNHLEILHLIPKGVRCKDKRLKEMTVKVCRVCHTKIHKAQPKR